MLKKPTPLCRNKRKYGEVARTRGRKQTGLGIGHLLPVDSVFLSVNGGYNKTTTIKTMCLFTVAKMWRQPKWPSTDKWIDKMWSSHTVDYYSALEKRKGILTPAAT